MLLFTTPCFCACSCSPTLLQVEKQRLRAFGFLKVCGGMPRLFRCSDIPMFPGERNEININISNRFYKAIAREGFHIETLGVFVNDVTCPPARDLPAVCCAIQSAVSTMQPRDQGGRGSRLKKRKPTSTVLLFLEMCGLFPHTLSISFILSLCSFVSPLLWTCSTGSGVACSQQCIRIDPNFAEAYSNLGNALKELGDVAGAVQFYLKVVRTPQNPPPPTHISEFL